MMIKVSSAVVVDAGALLSGFSWAKPLAIVPSAGKVEKTAEAVQREKGKRPTLQSTITEFVENQFDDIDSLQISDTEQFSLTIDLD